MAARAFRSRLERPPGVGTWTFAIVPDAVRTSLRLRTHMRVRGTIDGTPYRSSLIPRGGGQLLIIVAQPIRRRIGKEAGASVRVELELDRKPPTLRVPPDLSRALGVRRRDFDRLAPSHRKAFVLWVVGAKRPETRARRVAESVRMVREGRTLN